MDFSSNAMVTVVIALAALLSIVGVGVLFSRLYTLATKELTFVRTGLWGEKVVMDGGALVLPIFHRIVHVNMNTLRLVVSRTKQQSLITKDKMRVDVQAEFYVRVGKSVESISSAATTLGSKTTRPEELLTLIEGKFVDALRSVAASMEMGELHEQRKQFVAAVQEAVQVDLKKNGLELESVSLTGLDQTSREYFNENNAFDAEGLTKLTQEIEGRRKTRNQIEQDTRVEIERKKTEADKLAYMIAQENELAKIAQQKALDENRAQTESEIAVTRAEQKKIAEEAEIKRAREIEVANIEKTRDLALSEQQKKIAVAQKTEEEAAALAKANLAKAEAVKAEEQVETARRTEIANRDKAVAVIEAQREAERQAVEIKVAAEAEKAAAEDRAAAIITQAEADKQRDELRAEGVLAVGKAEAEALQLRNAAENAISQEAANLRLRLALTAELKGIIEASTKPLENVESIRIMDLDGFNPGASVGRGGDGDVSSGGGTAERIVGAALSHRAVAPLIDSVLAEVGITEGLSALVAGRSAATDPSPTAEVAYPKLADNVADVLDRIKPAK